MGEESNREVVVTPLDLEVGGTNARPTIIVQGEIDVATSPQLRSELIAMISRGATDLNVDLAGVTFIDSSGLGVLVGALKRLRDNERGGAIRIVGAQDGVRKVFEITGLHTVFLVDG